MSKSGKGKQEGLRNYWDACAHAAWIGRHCSSPYNTGRILVVLGSSLKQTKVIQYRAEMTTEGLLYRQKGKVGMDQYL